MSCVRLSGGDFRVVYRFGEDGSRSVGELQGGACWGTRHSRDAVRLRKLHVLCIAPSMFCLRKQSF